MKNKYNEIIKYSNDNIKISNFVIYHILEAIIIENKDLFKNKTYLNLRNPECLNVDLSNGLKIDINIKKEYNIDYDKTISVLRDEIQKMVKHITSINVDQININIL